VHWPGEAWQILANARGAEELATIALDARDANGAAPAVPSPPSALGMLAWMVQMSLADGQIDAQESQMIYRVAQRVSVSAQAGEDNAIDLHWVLRWR